MREIHCSHCLCGSGEPIGSLPCEPSRWEPQYQSNYRLLEIDVEDCVREDKAEVSQRMWGFEDETEEVPIVIGSPASVISQEVDLHPVSPLDLDSGESEAVGNPASTLATSILDKNIIPLPVERGAIHTSFSGRHHPYSSLPPATFEWTSAHCTPIVMHLAFFAFLFSFTSSLQRHQDLPRSLTKTPDTMIHWTSIQDMDYSNDTGLLDYLLLFPSQSQILLLSATKKPSSSSNNSRRRLGRNTPMFLIRSCKGFLVNH